MPVQENMASKTPTSTMQCDTHANLGEMKTTNDSKNANTDFKEMSDEEIEVLRHRWLSGIPEAATEPCSFCLWMEQVEYKAQKKSLQP